MTIGSNTSAHFFDTSFNTDGVLYSAASGVITSTSVGTAGQVLTSNGAGVAPSFQPATGGGMTWVVNPGSITVSANTGYFISLVTTLTLPASPSLGDTISFIEYGNSNITIQANTGQKIAIGPNQSAIAGTAADAGVCVLTLVYNNANTTWMGKEVTGIWNLN